MCLGVPGKVISLDASSPDMPMGKVSFGGIVKDVCMAYVPDVKVGEYVLVHVGFAISTVDEQEAKEVFALLEQIEAAGAADDRRGEAFGDDDRPTVR